MFRDCPEDLLKHFSGLKVGIAGSGGIGSNVAMLLARSGVTSFILVDFDKIELKNLNRQFFFSDQVGEYKVDALKINLKRINKEIEIVSFSEKLTVENAASFYGECDVLFEAVDDAKTKSFIIEEWSSTFPEKQIIACSGIAGVSAISKMQTKRLGKLSVVGDFQSSVELGTFSARVMAAASLMVEELYFTLSENKCSTCDGCGESEVKLECNGAEVPITGFPGKMLEKTVRGMVSSLKGVDSEGSIKIELDSLY